MDLVYEAIDSVNRAIKLVCETDFELTAISEAFLGDIYFRGLKKN